MASKNCHEGNPDRPAEGRPFRMLIVDDEEHVRNALRAWFLRTGFEVVLAENGCVAVEKCLEQTFDIITMDVEMPKMNGIDAIEQIRVTDPSVPIVILTGYAQDYQRAAQAGAQRILSKPLSLRELEKEVRALLGGAPSTVSTDS